MKIENNLFFSSLYCLLFQLLNRKSMFAVLHSDINPLKSDLLHLTSKALLQKSKIINLSLRNYLIDRYTQLVPGTNVIKHFSSVNYNFFH